MVEVIVITALITGITSLVIGILTTIKHSSCCGKCVEIETRDTAYAAPTETTKLNLKK